MLLIADSGSTKTDWKLTGRDTDEYFQSSGINPFYMSDEQILSELKTNVAVHVKQRPEQLYFYGAGVTGNQKKRMEQLFAEVFVDTGVHAESDLLGAARALCGDEEGIACIMGTGANSCLYDGEKIIDNIPPLGFIQGDEGSGAVLGKKLITMYLKRELSEELSDKFKNQYGLDTSKILRKVYQEAFPNRFLAEFAKFIHQNIEHRQMHQLVYESFIEFLERNVFKYAKYKKLKIHFVGSVAFYFRDIVEEVFSEKGLKLGKVIRSPLDELVKYHLVHVKYNL